MNMLYFRVAYKLMPENVEFYEAFGLTIGDRLNYVKDAGKWEVSRIAAWRDKKEEVTTRREEDNDYYSSICFQIQFYYVNIPQRCSENSTTYDKRA